MHLSRSGSPVIKKTEGSNCRVPSMNLLSGSRNSQYQSYIHHARETSLDRSKSRSLSRSSEYQSPGKKSGEFIYQQKPLYSSTINNNNFNSNNIYNNENNNIKTYNTKMTYENIHNDSGSGSGSEKNIPRYCNTEQVRINKKMVIRGGFERGRGGNNY